MRARYPWRLVGATVATVLGVLGTGCTSDRVLGLPGARPAPRVGPPLILIDGTPVRLSGVDTGSASVVTPVEVIRDLRARRPLYATPPRCPPILIRVRRPAPPPAPQP